MPIALYTIEEYIVKERKRDTYWLVFNTVYNDIHAFKKEPTVNEDGSINYLEKEFTDYKAREEFLEFMKINFPQTKILDVFDLVSASYLIYPYLGSIAIDCEKDDEVFMALSEKYGKPVLVDYNKDDELSINLSGNYEGTISNNSVFFELNYENALKFYNEKKEAWVDYDRSRNGQ